MADAPVRPTDVVKAVDMAPHPDGYHEVKCPSCGEVVGVVRFGKDANVLDEMNAIASMEKQCQHCGGQVHDLDLSANVQIHEATVKESKK